MAVHRKPSEMRHRHIAALKRRLAYLETRLRTGDYGEDGHGFMLGEMSALRFALDAIDTLKAARYWSDNPAGLP